MEIKGLFQLQQFYDCMIFAGAGWTAVKSHLPFCLASGMQRTNQNGCFLSFISQDASTAKEGCRKSWGEGLG